jgi:hypothetical protein
VIVYKDCPKSWLTSQWQLNQKVLPTKKGFLPEENMLMFADSRKIDWDDDFFKSFEFFPNQEEKKEMVLLRKSSSKKSSLGE